jgi:addiction module RelE/StbE family toxin
VIIQTTKSFDKQFAKLTTKNKQRFKEKVKVFQANPFDTGLRNHALKGRYLGYRSIDITGDVRALYTVKGDIVIIFGFIGTHSQLYA